MCSQFLCTIGTPYLTLALLGTGRLFDDDIFRDGMSAIIKCYTVFLGLSERRGLSVAHEIKAVYQRCVE